MVSEKMEVQNLLLSKKSYAICVFLDYKACFDAISRQILFWKLERYGLGRMSLDLVKSYYCNHNQYVQYNSCNSDVMLQ